MPYEIETKDGIVIRNIPDNISADDPSIKQRVMVARQSLRPDDALDASLKAAQVPNAAARMGRGMMDFYQGVKQKALNWTDPEAAKAYTSQVKDENAIYDKGRAYQAAQSGDTPGIDWLRVAGNIATPLSAVPMGAATLPGRMAAGAGIGGVAGYSNFNPVNTPDSNLRNTGVGMAVGAAVPAVITGAQSAYRVGSDIADLVRKEGPKNILLKYHDKIIGDNDTARQRIIDSLRSAKEFVPGSKPTAAEALVGTPEGSPLQAYQSIVSNTPGGPSAQFGHRIAEQEGARRAALEAIGKSPQELANSIKARDLAARSNYGTAYSIPIKADPEIIKLAENPYFREALPTANKLAQTFGITPKGNLTQYLHFVKIGLDGELMNAPTKAITSTEQAAINSVRQKLVDWLGKKNPSYDFARNEFADQSKIINRMQIGQTLQEKLVSATGKETPSSFANALRNEVATIKKATGQPRYDDISQLMTPQETQSINNVLADVTRKAQSMSQPQRTNLYGGVNVAEETAPKLPNLLSRPAMIANALRLSRANIVEREVDRLAAEAYLHPEKLAELLKKIPPKQRNVFIRAINSPSSQIVGMTYGATGQE